VRLASGDHDPKEYDFSRRSMEDRLRAGYEDTVVGFSRRELFPAPPETLRPTGVFIQDVRAEPSRVDNETMESWRADELRTVHSR
jgi:hypothetical protein